MIRNIHIGEIKLSFDDVEKLSIELAKKVQKEFIPDIVAGISRAGILPGLLIANYFDADFFPIIAKYPNGFDGEPNIFLPDIKIADRVKILIVDDITISGKTFAAVKSKIGAGKDIEMKTASLFRHPKYFNPDFYAQVTAAKLIFPWDVITSELHNRTT